MSHHLEPLPCPFCGISPAKYISDPGAPYPGGHFTIECQSDDCPAELSLSIKRRTDIPQMTVEQAERMIWREVTELWNRRNVHHETGLTPRELLEQRDNLLEWLDTLTLVVGLTPIAGNKEALQEAMDGARAAIAATKPEAVKGGEG